MIWIAVIFFIICSLIYISIDEKIIDNKEIDLDNVNIKNIITEKIYRGIIQNKMPYKLLWAPFKILTILSNRRKIKMLFKDEKDRYNNNIQSK